MRETSRTGRRPRGRTPPDGAPAEEDSRARDSAEELATERWRAPCRSDQWRRCQRQLTKHGQTPSARPPIGSARGAFRRTVRPVAARLQACQAGLGVAVQVFVAGLAADPELFAQLGHGIASAPGEHDEAMDLFHVGYGVPGHCPMCNLSPRTKCYLSLRIEPPSRRLVVSNLFETFSPHDITTRIDIKTLSLNRYFCETISEGFSVIEFRRDAPSPVEIDEPPLAFREPSRR